MHPTRPGHRALRTGRGSLANHTYHVTFTTHERQPHFHDFSCARIIASALNEGSLVLDTQTLAWCLMPDHLHWLVQLGEALPLSGLVQRFKSVTTKRLRQVGLSGRVWTTAYFDHALREEEDLQTVARYIVANPLRAGLVSRVGNYPHWDAIWL